MSYKLIQSTFGFKFLPPTSGDQNTNLRFMRQPAAPEPQPSLLFNTAGRRQVGKCPNLQLSTTDVMITINYTARQTEQPLSQSLHPLICLSSSAPFLIPIPPLHPREQHSQNNGGAQINKRPLTLCYGYHKRNTKHTNRHTRIETSLALEKKKVENN